MSRILFRTIGTNKTVTGVIILGRKGACAFLPTVTKQIVTVSKNARNPWERKGVAVVTVLLPEESQ
jgi:hypothetical protein